MWEFVHAEKLSSKKTLFASEQDRPDVARRRGNGEVSDQIDPARLVFIDETWTKTNMAPLRGWAPRGVRLKAKVPHGHWKTITFLAALRHDRIEAPWVLDGPINGESFPLYVEKVLLPTLRPATSSSWTISAATRSKSCEHVIRSAGARLFFLPKYSPDLNPIEQVFAKLKHLAAQSRRANRRGRLGRNRSGAQSLHARGMRQLLQKRRIRLNLNPSRSSGQRPNFLTRCSPMRAANFSTFAASPRLSQLKRSLGGLPSKEWIKHFVRLLLNQ